MGETRQSKAWRAITAFICVLLLATLAACAELPGSKRQQGAVAGGAGGAIIGGATKGTTGALVGGLLGAGLGYLAGWGWEEYDARQLNDTLETTPEGQTETWTNPDTGKAYEATPTSTRTMNGQPCRDVQIEPADADREPVMATACRDADGTWRLVNQ